MQSTNIIGVAADEATIQGKDKEHKFSGFKYNIF
jgi:hypothetical protein